MRCRDEIMQDTMEIMRARDAEEKRLKGLISKYQEQLENETDDDEILELEYTILELQDRLDCLDLDYRLD